MEPPLRPLVVLAGGLLSGWEIEQVGDLNGMADVVLKNTTTGNVTGWLMNGISVIGSGSPGTISNEWKIQP